MKRCADRSGVATYKKVCSANFLFFIFQIWAGSALHKYYQDHIFKIGEKIDGSFDGFPFPPVFFLKILPWCLKTTVHFYIDLLSPLRSSGANGDS